MLSMDYGTDCAGGPWEGLCNQRRYQQIQPPEYQLHQVDVPLALLSGAQSVAYEHVLLSGIEVGCGHVYVPHRCLDW
jgi:hypothetical protein